MSFDINNLRIGIVGLGYVGLPLAVEFGKKYPTVGFDIKTDRVAELKGGSDSTLECSSKRRKSLFSPPIPRRSKTAISTS